MEIRKIDYDFTAEDAVAFARYVADHDSDGRKKPRTQPWAWICLVVFVIAGLTSIWVEEGPRLRAEWAQQKPMTFTEWAWTLSLLSFLLGILLLYVFRNPIRSYFVRRRYRRPEHARWLGRYTLSISPETFTITTPLATATSKWEIIFRIATTMDHAFLLVNPRQAHIVPQRAFRDSVDFREFAKAMEDYYTVALRDKGIVK